MLGFSILIQGAIWARVHCWITTKKLYQHTHRLLKTPCVRLSLRRPFDEYADKGRNRCVGFRVNPPFISGLSLLFNACELPQAVAH